MPVGLPLTIGCRKHSGEVEYNRSERIRQEPQVLKLIVKLVFELNSKVIVIVIAIIVIKRLAYDLMVTVL
ncbi:MAG: hypothetical protein K2O58_03320, partial [Bacteroidales bacterium]|nr:hypothetical protein [Bacteroidales bacterium]